MRFILPEPQSGGFRGGWIVSHCVCVRKKQEGTVPVRPPRPRFSGMHTQPEPAVTSPENDPIAEVRRRRHEAADALVDALLQMWVVEQRGRRVLMSRSSEIGGENA